MFIPTFMENTAEGQTSKNSVHELEKSYGYVEDVEPPGPPPPVNISSSSQKISTNPDIASYERKDFNSDLCDDYSSFLSKGFVNDYSKDFKSTIPQVDDSIQFAVDMVDSNQRSCDFIGGEYFVSSNDDKTYSSSFVEKEIERSKTLDKVLEDFNFSPHECLDILKLDPCKFPERVLRSLFTDDADENFIRQVLEPQRLAAFDRITQLITQMEQVKSDHEIKAQRVIRSMGRCPMNYEWLKQQHGYRCAGGSHFLTNAEVLERFGSI